MLLYRPPGAPRVNTRVRADVPTTREQVASQCVAGELGNWGGGEEQGRAREQKATSMRGSFGVTGFTDEGRQTHGTPHEANVRLLR